MRHHIFHECAQVREEAPQISLNILMTAMDKIRLGLPQRPLEDSPAKRRMAIKEVGRVVAIALTPGMPPIENLSIKPRGGVLGRILFEPQVIIIQHLLYNLDEHMAKLSWSK